MGANVTWIAREQLAQAVKGDTTVFLHLGSLYPTVNNEVRVLDTAAVVVNSRTLAPLRFVGEAFGGTVTWDGATRTVRIYTRDSLFRELPKTTLDFSIGTDDLALYEAASPSRTHVRPGVALRLKVRVSKGNPTVEGGGRVVVSLGGQPLDTLPFYMDPADDDITFYKSCELPLNLNAGTSPLLRAVIEPDRLVTDPDLANNTISVPMDIQPPTLPEEGTDNAARIVSLSVHSPQRIR